MWLEIAIFFFWRHFSTFCDMRNRLNLFELKKLRLQTVAQSGLSEKRSPEQGQTTERVVNVMMDKMERKNANRRDRHFMDCEYDRNIVLRSCWALHAQHHTHTEYYINSVWRTAKRTFLQRENVWVVDALLRWVRLSLFFSYLKCVLYVCVCHTVYVRAMQRRARLQDADNGLV